MIKKISFLVLIGMIVLVSQKDFAQEWNQNQQINQNQLNAPIQRDQLSISMVTATSMENDLPFNILTGGNWKPEKGAQFVKVHMYLDEPIKVSKIEVESCDDSFQKNVVMYINFNERTAVLNKRTKVLTKKYNKLVTVRSLTLNFQKNEPLCIAGVRFYNKSGKINIKTPRIVDGTAKASSTLKPTSSYDIMNLFDSRYEYGWSSNRKDRGVSLLFRFSNKETIEKIKIWNGYQRSDIHCYSNSRVKTLKLVGDDGYKETIHVKDIMGPQIIKLKKPFSGKKLKMTVTKSYRGKFYKDLVISEMRFFDGDEWFMLNPLSRIKSIAKRNKRAFNKVRMSEILNKSLKGSELVKGGVGEWTLRLRSDSSFFMEGNVSSFDAKTGMEKYEKFYTLGNYEIKSNRRSRLDITVFGLLRTYKENIPMGMDCNGCGRDCNLSVNQSGEKETLFRDYFTLTKSKGKYIIKHTPRKRKIIGFKTLKMKIE